MENQVLPEIKVGDELAFEGGWGVDTYELHTVTKITASGRIVCGYYVLNPDLTIRGRSGYVGPFRGEIVTPEILEAVQRDRLLGRISNKNKSDLKNLSTDQLRRIVAIINEKEETNLLEASQENRS